MYKLLKGKKWEEVLKNKHYYGTKIFVDMDFSASVRNERN